MSHAQDFFLVQNSGAKGQYKLKGTLIMLFVTLERTVRSFIGNLILLALGLVNGHKLIHSLRVYIENFLKQGDLAKYATERRKAAVKAIVLLGRESDGHLNLTR